MKAVVSRFGVRHRNGMSRDQLSETHEVAFALFKYGLASDYRELATAMRISPVDARQVCEDLECVGLLAREA
jgi:hypothetical protein